MSTEPSLTQNVNSLAPRLIVIRRVRLRFFLRKAAAFVHCARVSVG